MQGYSQKHQQEMQTLKVDASQLLQNLEQVN